MQVRPEQLDRQLAKGVPPTILISGDEPLIVLECADLARRAARDSGCSEREIIEIAGANGWQSLLQSGGSMSLFAERKLIEVRLPSGKPGTEGSKAIQEFLALNTDDVLLIVAGKIDKQSQRAKWYTALDKAGIVVPVWPVGVQELPQWLGQRLQAAGLNADREAIQLLVERVEGNLLAAVQEVEKLKLLAKDNIITTATVLDSVLDNARYNPFGLVDTALLGDARSALRTLRGLEAEATQPPVILWALARELTLLVHLSEDCQNGAPIDRALKQRGVWRSREKAIRSGLNRQTPASLKRLQSLLFEADAATKGFGPGNPWDYLDQAIILLARGPQGSSSTRLRA